MMSGMFTKVVPHKLPMPFKQIVHQMVAYIILHLCKLSTDVLRTCEFVTYFLTLIFLTKISLFIFPSYTPNFPDLLITFEWREPCLKSFIHALVLILFE